MPALRPLVASAMPQLLGVPRVQMPTFTDSLGRRCRRAWAWADRLRGPVIQTQLPPGTEAAFQTGLLLSTGVSALRESRAARGRRAVKTRQFAAAATAKTQTAGTIAEFGDTLRALHIEAGWTQNKLAKHFEARNDLGENIVGLSKTRLSNACNDYQLFQTEDKVRYFVIACRAEPDLDVWVHAYHRAKMNGGRQETRYSASRPRRTRCASSRHP